MTLSQQPEIVAFRAHTTRTRSVHWYLFLPIGAVVVALAVIALGMTVRTAGKNVLWLDVTVGRWIQGADVPFGSLIAAFGNGAGSTTIGVSVALLAIWYAFFTRRWVDLVFLVSLFAARGVNAPLKAVAESPRPSSAFLAVSEFARGYGFPSGHSMSVLLIAGGLAYIIAAALPTWRLRALPSTVALLVILSTGYGRVETGAHWPTDVLGGFLWGSILLLVAIAFHQYLKHHSRIGSNQGA